MLPVTPCAGHSGNRTRTSSLAAVLPLHHQPKNWGDQPDSHRRKRPHKAQCYLLHHGHHCRSLPAVTPTGLPHFLEERRYSQHSVAPLTVGRLTFGPEAVQKVSPLWELPPVAGPGSSPWSWARTSESPRTRANQRRKKLRPGDHTQSPVVIEIHVSPRGVGLPTLAQADRSRNW